MDIYLDASRLGIYQPLFTSPSGDSCILFKPSLLFIHTFKSATQLLKTSFFVSQSLTNALSLPLTYSISSERVFIAVSHFSARKKKIETLHFRFNFPHYTQAKVKFPVPREGLKNPGRGVILKFQFFFIIVFFL